MSSTHRQEGQEFAPNQPSQGEPPFNNSQLLPTVNLARRHKAPTSDKADASPAIVCVTINGGRSVTGSRAKNEDSYLIDASRRLWAVSDGIGGAPFGEVISRVACNYLPKAWDAATVSYPQVDERLAASIRLVDTYVSELSDLLGHQGSGATLTAAHFDGDELTIAAVGDSRSFLLRDNALRQLGDDGRVSQLSNALDQALGYHLSLRPTIARLTPRPGDVVAICSDGVWATQSPERMRQALAGDLETPTRIAAEGNPQHMAYRLTEAADMSDNATAVVVLFVADTEPPLSTPSI